MNHSQIKEQDKNLLLFLCLHPELDTVIARYLILKGLLPLWTEKIFILKLLTPYYIYVILIMLRKAERTLECTKKF